MEEIFAFITGVIASFSPGFGVAPAPVYNGYIEADYVYVAPASPGRIEKLSVEEGQEVQKGALLFSLDAGREEAALRAAKAREEVARATWLNMETGSRVAEIAVIRASLAKAEADSELAAATFSRTEKLEAQGLVSNAQLDADKAKLQSAKAQLARLKAQLEVAELPARDAQLVAAEASLAAASADADRARTELANRTIIAPVSARVERVYFWAGEVAATGRPVVALLPPGELKVRFFLPEADRMDFGTGDILALECDGCEEGLTATISYMASSPQHTPPIIYSKDERSRLVFMAEARLAENVILLPGQPVSLSVIND